VHRADVLLAGDVWERRLPAAGRRIIGIPATKPAETQP
jgi:hypothetical protein